MTPGADKTLEEQVLDCGRRRKMYLDLADQEVLEMERLTKEMEKQKGE